MSLEVTWFDDQKKSSLRTSRLSWHLILAASMALPFLNIVYAQEQGFPSSNPSNSSPPTLNNSSNPAANGTNHEQFTSKPRGQPNIEPFSVSVAVAGIIIGLSFLLRGYRVPPRFTLFVAGNAYFAMLTYLCAISFTPALLQVILSKSPSLVKRMAPEAVVAASIMLVPLAVALTASIPLGTLPPKKTRRFAPFLLAAIWTGMIYAALLPYSDIPAYSYLIVLAVLSLAVQIWGRFAFRGVMTLATATAGAWIMMFTLDVVINRGVVWEFVAVRGTASDAISTSAIPTDPLSRIAVWLELVGAVALSLVGWISQLVRYQDPWVPDAFETIEGNRGKKGSWQHQEDDRFLTNA